MLNKTGSAIKILEVLHTPENYFKQNTSAFNRLAAAKIGWDLDPQNFLYVRARFVSSLEKHGFNANGDGFLHRELASRYATFINSAANVDHINHSPDVAVGFILDASYDPVDQFVSGVIAIDRKRAEELYPGIVEAVESGAVTDVSMGCFVASSICTSCLKEAGWQDGDFDSLDKFAEKLSVGGGVAKVPTDYCRHIGLNMERKGGPSGACEINQDVNFFEISFIRTQGADKDAKILEKIAEQKQVVAGWMQHLITVDKFKKSRGGEMESKKTAADGLKLDTGKEAGDFPGTPADKDKALADQAKGAAPAAPKGGLKLDTSDEKGQYLLASKHILEAVATIKTLAKENPDAFKILMATDPAADLGGEPKAVADGKKIEEPKKEDNADDRKPVPAAPAKKEAPVKEEPKTMAAKLFGPIIALMQKAIDGSGNPSATTKDAGDFPNGTGDINQAELALSKAKSDTTPDKGLKLDTKVENKDYPVTGARRRFAVKDGKIFVVADENKDNAKDKAKMDNMVDNLQKGKPYDEAKKDTAHKFGSVARVAARRAVAEDLSRGSMGSEGKPNSIKTPDDGSKGAPVKVSADDQIPPVPKKKPDEKKDEKVPVAIPPAKAAAEVPPVKKDGPDKADDTVKNLDKETDACVALASAKKVRASLLAKAGYKLEAARHIGDIEKLEHFAQVFETHANAIEGLMEGFSKQTVAGVAKTTLADKISSVIAEAKKAIAEAEKAIDEFAKKDDEDKPKVEAARTKMASDQRVLVAEKKQVEADNRLKAVLKRQAVDSLIETGRKKGIVAAAEIQAKIAELFKMSDVEFDALKKAWASLPDAAASREIVSRRIREASVVPVGMGTLTDPANNVRTASNIKGDWDPLAD